MELDQTTARVLIYLAVGVLIFMNGYVLRDARKNKKHMKQIEKEIDEI